MANEKITADEMEGHRNICILFTIIVGSLIISSTFAVVLALCLGQENPALFISLSIADFCLIVALVRLYRQYYQFAKKNGKK